MKPALAIIFTYFFLSGCIISPEHQLRQRWSFSFTTMPGFIGAIEQFAARNDEDIVTSYQKFFLGSKLIFRKDNSFDLVLFKNYRHGSWKFDSKRKQVVFTPEHAPAFTAKVDSVSVDFLQLSIAGSAIKNIVTITNNDSLFTTFMNNDYFTFQLLKDDDRYSNAADDLYSKYNNWWRIKPVHAETDAELKKRVVNHVKFYRQLFQDAIDKNRSFVAYSWFTSPVVVASNGIALRSYEKVQNEWETNFFDSSNARKGFEILGKGFSKKIDLTNIEQGYQGKIYMLNQVLKNINVN